MGPAGCFVNTVKWVTVQTSDVILIDGQSTPHRLCHPHDIITDAMRDVKADGSVRYCPSECRAAPQQKSSVCVLPEGVG